MMCSGMKRSCLSEEGRSLQAAVEKSAVSWPSISTHIPVPGA